MSFKQVGTGLGYFSLALGAAEVLAPGRIARALGLDEEGRAKGVIRAYGFREIAAGTMLLRGPAVSFNGWNRVIGDVIDAASLAVASKDSSRKQAVVGAMILVGAITIVDVVTAIGLDNETGRTFPRLRASYDPTDDRIGAQPETTTRVIPQPAAVPLVTVSERSALPLVATPEPAASSHEPALAATPSALQ